MDGLAASSVARFLPGIVRLPSRHRPVRATASGKGGGTPPELDKWEQMELQFGRLLGEDPKLTLAKVLTRKANPDISTLDVEKSFVKNKGRVADDMINMQIEMYFKEQALGTRSRMSASSQKANNMVNERKPVMSNGIQARRPLGKPNVTETTQVGMKVVRPNITMVSSQQSTPSGVQPTLSRPVMNRDSKGTRPSGTSTLTEAQLNPFQEATDKDTNVNIALRKPSVGEEIELEKNPKVKIQWNLLLKMKNTPTEKFTDSALLKKPDIMKVSLNPDIDGESSGDSTRETGALHDDVKVLDSTKTIHDKLEDNKEGTEVGSLDQSTNSMMNAATIVTERDSDTKSECIPESSSSDDALDIVLQPHEQNDVASRHYDASRTSVDQKTMKDQEVGYTEAPLLGKPTRLDPFVKDVSLPVGTETISLVNDGQKYDADVDHFLPADQEGPEANDWQRADQLLRTGERHEVELISCNGKGFVVSFGSLVGFLPYRNLGAKWKFLAFESWLRKKGLDPSVYRQNLSVLGNYDVLSSKLPLDSNENQDMDKKYEETLLTTKTFDDLLEAYDQEKTKFLSSFIGQRIRVIVAVADIKSRRLLFSGRPKEKEELVEKKRRLMAKLTIGDVVKCCIKKITYFGIFVEVEDVPALIHQSELSWDATLDLSSFYKIDQIIDAKVHQLDYALERIFLSLREVTPDPLMQALESVVGDRTSIEGSLEAPQSDNEWTEVESLIKELEQIDGVLSVSKGRYFLSPGLAPTFQVYMASMFENQYKLLARYGNKVQEILVQASLDKEVMKDAILTSTNRVV